MHLADIAVLGLVLSLAGFVAIIAIASIHRGIDIDRRQKEMDRLLAERRKNKS